MIKTEQDLISMQLAANSTVTNEHILRELIDEHDVESIKQGVRYYHNENDIRDRKLYYYKDGQKVVDREKVNNRIPHNWHKLLVDQKVAYLLGKPIVINAQPETYAKKLNEWLDEGWDDLLQELGKNSSNKGAEYLHPYIDEDGNLDYIIIPREQCIPIYDTDYEKKIVRFIRYYPMVVNGKERLRAEWWDDQTVTYYIENENRQFELDLTEEKNPDSHFYYNEKGFGWGKVPFVEFKNNEERKSDLDYYKDIIDIYDLINSDMANDLTDIQKLVYVLRGYDGTDLEEFMNNLRYYKAIKVDGKEGGVDTLQVDVPVEAINAFLDRSEENIFLFGQGVNVKSDKFGNSPSGISLKFLYGLLDLKANIMARKFSKAIKQFAWFVTEYFAISGEGNFNSDTVSVTFSKTMLINDKEMTEIAQQSKGVISDETIVSNHPWVEDTQAELERMQKEREGRVDLSQFNDDEEDEE